MNRRSFIKGLFAAGAVAVIPASETLAKIEKEPILKLWALDGTMLKKEEPQLYKVGTDYGVPDSYNTIVMTGADVQVVVSHNDFNDRKYAPGSMLRGELPLGVEELFRLEAERVSELVDIMVEGRENKTQNPLTLKHWIDFKEQFYLPDWRQELVKDKEFVLTEVSELGNGEVGIGGYYK